MTPRENSLKLLKEAALIEHIQAGDEGAFTILFDRHVGALRTQIRRRLPSNLRRKVSVSDVLQETRLVAFQRMLDHPEWPDGAFRAWVFQIVKHKIRDTIRKYEGTAKLGAVEEISRGGRPGTSQFSAKGPSPSEAAEKSEMNQRILEVMEELPEQYREVIRLAWLEQRTLREVGERIGRSREVTKKLSARAIAKFTQLYVKRRGRTNG